jgi:hypothetical protein
MARNREIPARKWRDIQTAPRDGSKVMVGVGSAVHIAHWGKVFADEPKYSWIIWESFATGTRVATYIDSPSHWTPLPRGPE